MKQKRNFLLKNTSRLVKTTVLSSCLLFGSQAWGIPIVPIFIPPGVDNPVTDSLTRELSDVSSGLVDIVKDGADFIDDTFSSVIEQAEDAQAFALNIADSTEDVVIDFNLEIIEDTFNCSTSLFSDGCVEDVIKKVILGTCLLVAESGSRSGEFETIAADGQNFNGSDTQRISSPISDQEYLEIERIFDVILDTPGFTDYVKNNVKHFQSDAIDSGFRGLAIMNNIYYRDANPEFDLVVHELVHVWQYYRQVRETRFAATTEYCENVFENLVFVDSRETTRAFTLDINRNFTSYRFEQEAEIVESYVLLNTGASRNNSNFLNSNSFNSDIERQNALKRVMWSVNNSRPFQPDFETQISGQRVFFENFNGASGLLNDGPYEWSIKSGDTPSTFTGPNSDASGNGYYIYVETSSGHANSSGNQAMASFSEGGLGYFGYNFKYYMHGKDVGTLSLETATPGGWVTIWSKSGQQQFNSSINWRTASATGYSGLFRFKVTANGGYQGDIAIDDVELVQITQAEVEAHRAGGASSSGSSSSGSSSSSSSSGGSPTTLAHNPPGAPGATISSQCEWRFQFNNYGTRQHHLYCNGVMTAELNEFLGGNRAPGTPSCTVANVRSGVSGAGSYGTAGGVCEFWIQG